MLTSAQMDLLLHRNRILRYALVTFTFRKFIQNLQTKSKKLHANVNYRRQIEHFFSESINVDNNLQKKKLFCEDLLPTHSYCHSFGESKGYDSNFCTCAGLTQTHACDTQVDEAGFGSFQVNDVCLRHCGKCSNDRAPLFYEACPTHDGSADHDSHHHGDEDGVDGSGGGDGGDDNGSAAVSAFLGTICALLAAFF